MEKESFPEHHRSGYKRGYLNEDFLLFHLKDKKGDQLEYHYHDFYKIIVFLSGKVNYLIEGKTYPLQPWDILLVTNKDIHKAIIDINIPYERFVIWLKPAFLEKSSSPQTNLLSCFEKASREKRNLVRLDPESFHQLKNTLFELEAAWKDDSFGADIMKNTLLLHLVIYLNRVFSMSGETAYHAKQDKVIDQIVTYIGKNLRNELTIEILAEKFFISKPTLMHRFKEQTGYTVHNFILQKRLIAAGIQIRKGIPALEASYDCGFSDYSSFVRAFQRFYGMSPRQYKKEQSGSLLHDKPDSSILQ